MDKLFEVLLKHDFYRDHAARNLSVQPTEWTSRMIRNNRLLFREYRAGFFVAGETSDKPGDDGDSGGGGSGGGDDNGRYLKRTLPDNRCLLFHIISKSSEFPTITNLSMSEDEASVFRFNNRTGIQSGDALLLHPFDFTGMNSSLIPLQNKGVLNFSVQDQTARGTASVRTEDGRVVLSQTVDPLDDVLGFQFDLTSYSSGFYTLWFENAPAKTFYYCGERLAGSLLGVVEIETGDKASGLHRLFDDTGKLNKPEYHIRFQQRSTIWRYHIIFKSGQVVKNPVIVAGDYTFKMKEGGDTPDDYLIFESEQMIPLSEKGISNISLRRQTGAALHLVHDNLPNPDIHFAVPDPADYNKLYSDIFVYL